MNLNLFKKDQLGMYTLILIGVVGILDTLALILYGSGINVGIIFPMLIGMALIMYSYLKIKGIKLFKDNSKLLLLVKTCVAIFTVTFVLMQLYLLSGTKSEIDKKADYLLILGSGLVNERITLTLKERLDQGLIYLNKYPDVKVVVSGGKGLNETISEAKAMSRYLIENGIDEKRIILEDKSTSTFENMLYTKQELKLKTGKDDLSIMVVTNDFHIKRAKLLAKRCGFIPYGLPCKTPWQVFINNYSREYFAYVKTFIFDRVN